MITLKGLNKRFGECEIYNDVNYTFKERRLTCFFGPSGSGKTTLLNLLAGFDSDYTGDIVIFGKPLKELSEDKLCEYRFNNIGFIFQNYNLLKGYTALENILMGMNLNDNTTEGEKTCRALELLSSMGLLNKKDQKIDTLSGGEKQRVAIARALINDPKIILADEPTGALDGEATLSIMNILKEISKEKTVIIITHDEEVSSFADEIIELEDYNIVIKKETTDETNLDVYEDMVKPNLKKEISREISFKNFKIHFFKFLVAGLIIAFGSSAFVGALGSRKITERIIDDFKTKNFFYNIAQAPIDKKSGKTFDEIINTLKSRDDVENIYSQYDLENMTLKNGDKSLKIEYKVPTALSNESLVYGNMPRENENEITIAVNVANRLTDDVKSLLGKEITLSFVDENGEVTEKKLKVSGLMNSQYQDFVVSRDIEKGIYKDLNMEGKSPTATSFDIKNFEEISKVDKELKKDGIGVLTRGEEVDSFQKSFEKLLNLYNAISYIILVVGMIISGVILYKVSLERYREVGLLGALGYNRKNINSIMFRESVYFAVLSSFISCGFIFILDGIYKMQFGYGLELNIFSFIILIIINLGLTIGLSSIINLKLIKTEPAKALRS